MTEYEAEFTIRRVNRADLLHDLEAVDDLLKKLRAQRESAKVIAAAESIIAQEAA